MPAHLTPENAHPPRYGIWTALLLILLRLIVWAPVAFRERPSVVDRHTPVPQTIAESVPASTFPSTITLPDGRRFVVTSELLKLLKTTGYPVDMKIFPTTNP